MNVFAENVQALTHAHPLLAQELQTQLSRQQALPLVCDNAGRSNLKVQSEAGEHWLYPEGMETQLDQMVEQIHQVDNPQILLWVGLGLGHHLAEYLKRPHPLNRYLVIVEPSWQFFLSFLAQTELSELLTNPQIFWLVGIPEEEIEASFYGLFDHPELAGCVECHSIVDLGLHGAYNQTVKTAWQTVCEEVVRETEVVEIDAYMGFVNAIANLPTIANTPLLEEFKDVFAGKPGIVVSTGPSLGQSLDYLKAVQDKVVIFAVDSALRILQEHGIKAHFTGCMERQQLTQLHFSDVDTQDTTLVTTPIVHPVTYETFQGPKIHVVREIHHLPWLFPEAELHGRAMSSVSHLGLFSLAYMGCGPIYLLGQDLAYDPTTRQTHADGYSLDRDEEFWSDRGHQHCQALSNRGVMIETMAWWYQVARFIGHMIHEMDIECYNVIPLTHGIRVPGTQHLEPAEAFSQRFTASIDVRGTLQAVQESFASEQAPQQTQLIATTLPQTREWLERLIAKTTELSQQIYDFYLQHPPIVTRRKTMSLYQGFFQILERETARLMEDPLYHRCLGPVVQGRHLELARISFSLLSDDETEEALTNKLNIPLAWFEEILTRAHLCLHQLEQLN